MFFQTALNSNFSFRRGNWYQTNVNPAEMGIIYPNGETAFKALLSARFCAAVWSHISDCDETFNYWEPVSVYLVY